MPAYDKLVSHLKKLNRLDWVQDELQPLMEPRNFELPDPRNLYLRVKNVRTLKPKGLSVMREIAAWRETEARRRDCLAKFIVRDESLLQIARQMPQSTKELHDIRGINGKEISKNGEVLLELVKKGVEMPEQDYPVLPESESYATNRGVEELLSAYVQIRSEELKIEPHMLADRKQIHSFVHYHEQNDSLDEHPLFKGWRKGLIGSDLHQILEGRQGLVINKKGRVSLTNGNHRSSPS